MGFRNMLPSVETSRPCRAYCPACKQAKTWGSYHRLEEDTRREQGNAAVVQDLRQISAERFAAMLTSVHSATYSAQGFLRETSLVLSDFLLKKDAQREAFWVCSWRSLTGASPARRVSAFTVYASLRSQRSFTSSRGCCNFPFATVFWHCLW